MTLGTRLADHVVNELRPEVDKLANKATRKSLSSDTEQLRVQVVRELAEDVDELLDSVHIRVSVGDRSFTVKGFGSDEDD